MAIPQPTRDLTSVWNQGRYPVVVRGSSPAPLIVRLPYSPGNRDWLQAYIQRRELDMNDIQKHFFEKYMEKVRQKLKIIS